jgi:CO/xanthine dehydrogenase Mo-binding subunit
MQSCPPVFAYAQRGQTIVALAVEVEVNAATGRVWPRRWTVAHDCILLLDGPELLPSGAGEGSIRPVAAAIGNAIFDATGIRLRRAPFTPERVKAAIG